MNADIDALATLIAGQLTAASSTVPFSQPYTCEFNDTPIFEHSDLHLADGTRPLKVVIFPARFLTAPGKSLPGQRKAQRFRGINEYQYVLSLWFEQEGPDPPTSGVDPLKAFAAGLRLLVQETLHWLNDEKNSQPWPPTPGTGLWLKTIENVELYDVAALKLERRFESHTLLTYEEFVRE